MERWELEDEQEALKGIASILLSLAVLAEFLCLLPLWVRIPVLAILRPAEAVARAFALELACGGLALPPAASPGPDRDGRIEAIRLARCFRVLAAIFKGLLSFEAGWRAFRGGPAGRSVRSASAVASRNYVTKPRLVTAVSAAGRFDTS
jgi:hypothetical protein